MISNLRFCSKCKKYHYISSYKAWEFNFQGVECAQISGDCYSNNDMSPSTRWKSVENSYSMLISKSGQSMIVVPPKNYNGPTNPPNFEDEFYTNSGWRYTSGIANEQSGK